MRSRAFTEDGDLALVSRFLSECVRASPPQAFWHPGDFVWTLYQNEIFDPTTGVRLWEDGSGLLGFALLEEPDGFIMQVRPDAQVSRGVERAMISWAAKTLGRDEISTRHTELTSAYENPVHSLLQSVGFVRDEDHYLNMHRPLDDDVEAGDPPRGWTVRPVGGEEEWERRVNLHRDVWNSSRVTPGAYRNLRNAPGYDPTLDLVAVNEAGEFGSYCICWYDRGCSTGLFEPVGTSERFRRTGLGREIMTEGLDRLKNLGATSAFVTSAGSNEASRRLYESVGFCTVGVEYLYGAKTKDLLPNLL